MYLYVIEFSDGDIKVGRTSNFSNRLKSLASDNKMIGKRDIVRHFHTECNEVTEKHALQFCISNCTDQFGAEYFSGVSFDRVKEYLTTDSINFTSESGGSIVNFNTNVVNPSNQNYMNATLLVNDGNRYRMIKGLNPIPLTVILKSEQCRDYIDVLKKMYPESKIIISTGKGAGKRTYVRRELGISIACYLSVDFKLTVYKEVADMMINSSLQKSKVGQCN